LQKVRGQIRSRLVLSPLSDAIKKKKKKIPWKKVKSYANTPTWSKNSANSQCKAWICKKIFYLLKCAKRIRHKLSKLMKSSPIYKKLQHYLIENACLWKSNIPYINMCKLNKNWEWRKERERRRNDASLHGWHPNDKTGLIMKTEEVFACV
jgi:hypothetical protein